MLDQSIKYEGIEKLYNMSDEEKLDELGGYVGGNRGGIMAGVRSLLLSKKIHESKLERGDVVGLFRHYLGIQMNHQSLPIKYSNVLTMIEIREREGSQEYEVFESLNKDKVAIESRYLENLYMARDVIDKLNSIDPTIVEKYIYK